MSLTEVAMELTESLETSFKGQSIYRTKVNDLSSAEPALPGLGCLSTRGSPQIEAPMLLSALSL